MDLCSYSVIGILKCWWITRLLNIWSKVRWKHLPLELKTLLIKLSEYTIDLKYQKGSEMHTSNALGILHNLMDTPDNKDVILLNFLQHLTPNFIEHTYSHWVDNVCVHRTKDYDTTQVMRKHSRPPKKKTGLDNTQKPAANTCTILPKQMHKNSKSEILSRDLIEHINKE